MNQSHDLQASSAEADAISALADGALRGAPLADALTLLAHSEDARSRWNTYHVIGDVLRTAELAPKRAPEDFIAKLEARLAAQDADRPVASADVHVVRPDLVRAEAANDSFLWKMVAGFASLAAVVAIGWSTVSTLGAPGAGPVLASAAQPAVASRASPGEAAPQVMIRNPQLDELLAAHNQAVGGSALHAPGSFVRNANFTSPGER